MAADADGVADVDFLVSLDPNDISDIYLTIVHNNGRIEFSDRLNSLDPVTRTLETTETDDYYIARAWLDANHNGLIDYGEDMREVYVHVFDIGDFMVVDHIHPDNYATATDAAIGDLYIGEKDPELDLSVLFDQVEFNGKNTGDFVRWQVVQDGSLIAEGDFSSGNLIESLKLNNVSEADNIELVVYLDQNKDGLIGMQESLRKFHLRPTAIEWKYTFHPDFTYDNGEIKYGKSTLWSSVECTETELTVQMVGGNLLEGDSILSFIQGSYGKDSDSGQVAVRWTDKDGNVIDSDTNAQAISGDRRVAAKWTEGRHDILSWSTEEVPEGATHVEIVLIYTDVSGGNPATCASGFLPACPKNPTYVNADVPVILGYWTGDLDLETNKWKIVPDKSKITQPMERNPTAAEVLEMIANVAKFVEDHTGYKMAQRAGNDVDLLYKAALAEWAGPNTDETLLKQYRAWIDEALAKAIKDKKIKNTPADTGYDIVVPKEEQDKK